MCSVTYAEAMPRSRRRLQYEIVEMQARRRCGNGAWMARVHGLIALGVGWQRGAADIGRQRNFAVTIEIGLERNIGIEPQAKESTVALEHRRAGAAFEQDAAARTGKVAGGKLHPRFGWRDEAFEQQLDLAAARLAAIKARADDPGVVENQEIARGEQPRQFGKMRDRAAALRLRAAGVRAVREGEGV